MAVLVKTRPTFRSCFIWLPSRVSASGRRLRSESSPSSSPRSLRPSLCARCSPSSRWKPGDELECEVPPLIPNFESPVVGGRLVGGVRLLLPGPMDVAGVLQDGTAGRELATDDLFRTHPAGIPAGAVRRFPAVLHKLGDRQHRVDAVGPGPRTARRLRAGHQAGQANARRTFLLHL